MSSSNPSGHRAHVKAHVALRRRRIGEDDDSGGRPGIPFLHGLGHTSEGGEEMRTIEDRQTVKTTYVLARDHDQALELRDAEYHDVFIDEFGLVGGRAQRPVAGHPLPQRA